MRAAGVGQPCEADGTSERRKIDGGCICSLGQEEQLSADLTAAAKPLAMDYMTLNAVKSEIRMALISQKANACPMAARVAW